MSSLLLLGLGTVQAVAQTPEDDSHPDFVVRHWTTADNLPINALHDVIQTSDGYLWASTQSGLVRFDGQRFTVYTTTNSPGLISNLLEELYEDAEGNLWVRMSHGDLVRYRDGLFTAFQYQTNQTDGLPGRATGAFYTEGDTLWILTDLGLATYYQGAMHSYRPDLIRAYVTDLLRDNTGSLWVSTYSDGLFQITPDGEARRYTSADGLPEAAIRTVYEAQDGTLWVGTEGGVVRRRTDRFEQLLQDDLPWAQPIYTIRQDDVGTLWFGGEHWWSYEQGRVQPFAAPESAARLADIDEQGTGALHIGPAGHTWRIQGSWLYRDEEPIYQAKFDRGFTFDQEGNLWFGNEEGLFQLRRRVVRVLSEAEGLPGRNLYPILEDRTGAIWLGTWGHGLAQFDGTTVTPYDLSTGPSAGPRPNNHVLSLFQDRRGTLWVGRGGILCRMQGARCIAANISLSSTLYEDVRAMHEDRLGRLWFGTGYSGLVIGTPRGAGYAWTHVSTEQGLTSDWVRVIVETRDGDILLGTNGGGILRFVPSGNTATPPGNSIDAPGTFIPFIPNDDGTFDNVQDIYEDTDGLLWIATEDRGLCRLGRRPEQAQNRFICLDTDDGLFDHTIYRIIEDNADRFWLSTNRGLFWVERTELNAFAARVIGSVSPVGYTEHDGMRNRQANGGVQPAGIKARDGRLWFPTQDGAAVIDPSQIDKPQAPPVVIETVQIGSETRRSPGTLVLAPGERDIVIEYTAPVYSQPEDVRFRYMLEGYDDTWQEAGTLRRASYSDLPPGTYTLSVMAGLGGSWNEQGATLTIERIPYIWETTWFLVLSALLGGLGIFGLYKYRLRQVEARTETLEQKVIERTAQLREQQTRLEHQAKQLRQANELKSRFLANISHEFRTPLTLTLGPLEDIQQGRYGPLADAIHQQLGLAHRNAQRLLRLINQLLDLSKLEAGVLVYQPRRYDLTGFLRRLTSAFDGLAHTRHLTLRFDAPDPPLLFVFDADQLEKIVLNLLSNAFKFTPEGGTIGVRVYVAPDGGAVIEVSDTGIGIPAEHLPHLFDRFYQVDSATTRKHEGTGIGLALIKELVDLHSGTLQVDSVEGEGTTFTMTLHETASPDEQDRPIATPPDPNATGGDLPEVLADLSAPEPPVSIPAEGPDEEADVILIVEDMDDMRAYLRTHLEDTFLVIEAENGAVGLERALELVPDLIISDVMMPEMDGYGLCRAVKADPRTSHIPIVLLTARADIASRIVGFETGADAYLPKPFNADELHVRVRTLIEQRRKLRALYNGWDVTLEAEEVKLPPLDAAFLEHVHETITTHLDNPDFGVDALAEEAGMSRRQLLRKLKALTDEKPNALIRRRRLERAAEMLRGQEGSVKEIAYAVGFRSATHFSKIFQEAYHLSPTAYAEGHAMRSDPSL